MARMKLEVQAQRRAEHGLSLRDRLVSGLPRLAALSSHAPALFNLPGHVPLLRRAAQRWLGLAAERSLPPFLRDTFWRSVATLQPVL